MSQVIGILNYGLAGNIFNIQKVLNYLAVENTIVLNHEDLYQCDKLIIPGVGSFYESMVFLNKNNMIEPLKDFIKNKPTLGICLGMQILATIGFEGMESKGLGFINAEVKKIECKGSIPHMGFNTLEILNSSDLFKGINELDEFYFMHSYEVVNYTNILSLTNYHGHSFVSAIQSEKIFGVQFHPEKSRESGLKIFKNFIEI